MKKILKSILLIIVILSITVIFPTFMDSMDLFGTEAKAEDAGWKETIIESDPETTPGGSTKDPFVVLEIVPNKAMSEISYLVAGEEPIEQQLFDKFNASGDLKFLGGAITPYDSYMEKSIASTESSNVDTNCKPRITYCVKNGYFKYVGKDKGGEYQPVSGQTVYSRVPDGTGSYNAKLVSENTNIYNENEWLVTNQKNVNAYFQYGKKDAKAPTTTGYEPCSVTRNTENKGDYDYNVETKIFSLNKGKGEYDVLFERSVTGTNLYYMQSDYQVVDDCTGDYSWNIEYVAAAGGNYSKITNGMTFHKTTGDHSNFTYVWVDAEKDALSKPSNFYVENAGTNSEKIWVKGQKFEKYYEMNYNVTLVNNEFFKRYTLGISADNCKNFKVRVITMTPSELNQMNNQALLSRANMFYINDNYDHNYAYMKLYETKNQKMIDYLKLHPEQKFDNVKSSLNFATDDLSWSSTMRIFNRVAGVKADGTLGGYRAAILFDNKFFQNALDGANLYGNPYKKDVTVSFHENSSSATVVNIAKLFIMVYQRDPVEFYKMFLKSGAPYHINEVSSLYNSSGTTGSFKRPDSVTSGDAATIEYTFWNGNTFCPYMYDDSGNLITNIDYHNEPGATLLKKNISNFNIRLTPTDLIANVLTINGQDIFAEKYMKALDQLPPDAIEAAKIYAASQNGGVIPTTISIANCIQLISNEGTGYGNSGSGGSSDPSGENGTSGSNLRTYISVLNIEPTADYTVSESNINTMLTGYSKSVKITSMTSAEFNSSILDINTHYDMIYIGGGAGRFNQDKSGTSSDIDGTPNYATCFNKSEYNGSYYNTGDNVNGILYSSGNDITQQKENELQNFLNAGYPIVFENSIYTLTRVRNDTKLYSFIQTAKGTTPPKNVLNYYDYKNNANSRIQFMANLMTAIEIVRPMIRMVQPILADGSAYDYIYVDPATNILNIEFAILPRDLVADRTIKYNAYLYLDYNEDGIFSSNEELTAVPSDGSTNRGLTESKFKAYLYSYDMSKYNGVYQWQVKVVRQYMDAGGVLQDTQIRSEITGYAACSRREAINILQITDNPDTDATACSLESKVNDGSSLIRKYAGYGNKQLFDGAPLGKLKDYDIVFHTMSVKDFLEQYKSQPYTDETAATANRLSDYHVLILDNQSDIITDENGALKNIKAEITKGMGIIFTKGAIRCSTQSGYFNTDLFLTQKTYPILCRIATPNTNYPYHIFDFNDSGFKDLLKKESTYHTTYLTKTNEGSDAQYPYKIGNAIQIADSSYQEDVTIDYSRITSAAPLIGWYALSDSRSPVVRSAGLTMDTAAKTYSGIYSTSPNDTKNNYYLFNMGKIYFSGIQLQQADVYGNDSEIKLFINTIIATYKTSGRILAKPPVITMKNPLPVDHVITLLKTDVGTKTEIPFFFDITNSSSHMDLSLSWNDKTTTSGNWNKKIYEVSSTGELTLVTDLTNIANGSYAVKIPVTDLKGSNKLSINAKNVEGKQTTLNTTINYSPDPFAKAPEITMKNPLPVDHVITLLKTDVGIKTEIPFFFDITNSSSHMDLSLLWNDETTTSGNWNKKIYEVSSTGELTLVTDLTNIANGSYAVKIPVTDLKGSNKLTINAMNVEGEHTTLNTTINYSPDPFAKAPDITMKNPLPVDHVITLLKADVGVKTEIPFFFDITNSSSHMDLSLLWNDETTTSGNWNKKIYMVSSTGELTLVTDLTNIANGSYAVKIPVTDLKGSNKLTINAMNVEGEHTTLNTTINYSPDPVANAPVITMKNPLPFDHVITLLKTDIGTKTEIPFLFDITNSSSHMELSLLWNDKTTTSGNWNKNIYKVSSTGELTLVTDLTDIANGSYAVKIPVTDLKGSNKLSINAKNVEGKQTTLNTTINYSPDPVAVSIINEDLVKNVDNGLQYLYIDIDYDETDHADKETDYLAAAENIKLQFKVEHVLDQCSILITDADGKSISIKNGKIYPAATAKEETEPGYKPGEKTVANGSYYINIPASIINSLSNKDITITAKVSDIDSASTTVKLLRRGMFQLD